MTNLGTAKDLLVTLRQALYVYDDHLCTTVDVILELLAARSIDELLDELRNHPDLNAGVAADEYAADPVG